MSSRGKGGNKLTKKKKTAMSQNVKYALMRWVLSELNNAMFHKIEMETLVFNSTHGACNYHAPGAAGNPSSTQGDGKLVSV